MEWLYKNKKMMLLGIGGVAIMCIACLLLYQPMMNFLKDPEVLKKTLESYGIFGGMLLVLMMSLQVVFVFLPGEMIEVLAGFIYGPMIGMFLCMLGTVLGSSVIYLFVRKFGIAFVDHLVGKEKLEEVSFLRNHEKLEMLVFIIFFIPGTPKDIITYFIPLTDMKLSKFLIITSVARIPSIITSTIGGNALGNAQYLFTFLLFVITGLVSLLGIYIYKTKICHMIHYSKTNL